jgi:hypothetical protein
MPVAGGRAARAYPSSLLRRLRLRLRPQREKDAPNFAKISPLKVQSRQLYKSIAGAYACEYGSPSALLVLTI